MTISDQQDQIRSCVLAEFNDAGRGRGTAQQPAWTGAWVEEPTEGEGPRVLCVDTPAGWLRVQFAADALDLRQAVTDFLDQADWRWSEEKTLDDLAAEMEAPAFPLEKAAAVYFAHAAMRDPELVAAWNAAGVPVDLLHRVQVFETVAERKKREQAVRDRVKADATIAEFGRDLRRQHQENQRRAERGLPPKRVAI